MDYVTNKVGQQRPYGFKYSPQTGLLYRSRTKAGTNAKLGPIGKRNRKYMRIFANGKEWMIHRLAFLFMNKYLPEGEIGGTGTVVDHINGNTHDNRWENLKIVEKRENDQNKEAHRSGRKCGVSAATRTPGRWEARIVINKRLHHIGTFGSEQDAYNAYLKAVDDWEKEGIKPKSMEEKRKYMGISLMTTGKWRSRIGIEGKYYELGYYTDKDEAAKAYATAKLNWKVNGVLPE